MAKLKIGILGAITGLVGTVVGSTWRGIAYIRSKGPETRSNSSEDQKKQQSKFGLMVNFLHSMKDLLQLGYKDHGTRMTEINSALSYNIKNAITGNYPDYAIAYPMVQISRGNLPNAKSPAASAETAGAINFNWLNNAGIGKAKAGDRAILVAHCPELQQTVYIVDPLRSAAAGVLAVPEFSGMDVQTWISFLSEDKKDVSTSIFTGEVNVL
ncbi:MAG: hypothetical protein J7497_01805 [Chitinophagaceae bacterium]|nr:hypothetical protein [Chitinophagaceae bacterium]